MTGAQKHVCVSLSLSEVHITSMHLLFLLQQIYRTFKSLDWRIKPTANKKLLIYSIGSSNGNRIKVK